MGGITGATDSTAAVVADVGTGDDEESPLVSDSALFLIRMACS